MKKLSQYALPVLILFIMAAWNYSGDPDKAVVLIADENEKITRLESGSADAAVFAKGIKSLTVLHHLETYKIIEATFVYSPSKGDAQVWKAQYDSDNKHINPVPADFVNTLESIQAGSKIIVDNILYADEAGVKKYLSPIVITIK